MAKIYVTGHRHPDLDTICAALAYANLKNMLDPENEYIPVYASRLSENVENVLKKFEITPPVYMPDVYPKVRDVMLTEDLKIDCDATLADLARIIGESYPSALPIYHENEFYGLLTVDDVAKWSMKELLHNGNIKTIPTIKDIMEKQSLELDASMTFDEVKTMIMQADARGFAVYDNGKYCGYVTRRCFLKTPKYNVILVDHNEPKQSIHGIESANVMEIVDHHRIDAVKTELPVFIDAEPLGSTCTIIYQLYQRYQKPVSATMAKILLIGMLSDTLVLKSPTTTAIDREAAKFLSVICDMTLQEFSTRMYANVKGLGNRDPKEAILADFKKYEQNKIRIGIGQCEVTTLVDINTYREKLLETLTEVKDQQGLDWALLLITDVLKDNSVLLVTNFKANSHLPYVLKEDRVYDLPGIVSRKKQLLPEVINTINSLM